MDFLVLVLEDIVEGGEPWNIIRTELWLLGRGEPAFVVTVRKLLRKPSGEVIEYAVETLPLTIETLRSVLAPALERRGVRDITIEASDHEIAAVEFEYDGLKFRLEMGTPRIIVSRA